MDDGRDGEETCDAMEYFNVHIGAALRFGVIYTGSVLQSYRKSLTVRLLAVQITTNVNSPWEKLGVIDLPSPEATFAPMPCTISTFIRFALLSATSFLVVLNIRVAVDQRDADPRHSPSSIFLVRKNGTTTDARGEQLLSPPPPLDSIVNGWNITGDASWLLNFAIIGFPKTGTSTLMFLLGKHPQVRMFRDERCDMSYRRQAVLIRDLYSEFQPAGSPDLVRGIKCPGDLENTQLALPNYQKFFPRTRYIVGIRHPVLWFESFYNFRVQNGFPMPSPHKLVGRCGKGMFNVCTFRGNFHLFLSSLGKTQFTKIERDLMGPYLHIVRGDDGSKVLNTSVTQPLFLYEISQLSDPNTARAGQMRRDLKKFLMLDEPIPQMIWFKPGRNQSSTSAQKSIDEKKIDICQPQYDDIRGVLMEQAVNASLWIRQYFVNSPNVVVSSKEYFVHDLMASWERDPCATGLRTGRA